MRPHTSVISGEMPDYMRGEHEWARPLKKLHTPAKGLKSVLNQVSPDAPASFLLKYITPSTPEARRRVLIDKDEGKKDARLIQELKRTHYRDFQKFMYEDNSPIHHNVDLTTLPMKQREDFRRDISDGIRAKLPFYQEYAAAAKDGKFPVKQGMFMYNAGLNVVSRTEVTQLKALRSHSISRLKDCSCDRSPSASHTPTLNLSAFASSRGSVFNTKSMRAVLTPSSSHRSNKARAKSVTGDGGAVRDIAQFEARRKTAAEPTPTTKKALWEQAG